MAGERQDSRWVIRPSLWFDAVCLAPLLAGLPFYTSREPVTTAGRGCTGPVYGLARLDHCGRGSTGRCW